MSVLFRGIEYPKTCSDCLMHDVDDDYCRALGEYVGKGKPMWCPAEEVKVPHGRIIDYDKLLDGLNNPQNGKMCGELARECTILEAEGVEE